MQRTDHWIEIASAILLALATIGSAWCAYEASRWSGVQTVRFTEANAARTDAARLSNQALTLTAIDVGTWVQYVTALSEGNDLLANFISERFRPPMKAANAAWLATKPLQNPDAPPTPFAMKEYDLPERQQAQDMIDLAEQRTEEAKSANQRADNYILLTVIFASVLFFGGVGTKFETRGLRIATILIGALVLIGLAITLASYPVY